MIETGLMARWIEEFNLKNLCAANDNIIGGQVAKLGDVYGTLILLGLGLLVAIMTFLTEIYWRKRTLNTTR